MTPAGVRSGKALSDSLGGNTLRRGCTRLQAAHGYSVSSRLPGFLLAFGDDVVSAPGLRCFR